MGAKQRKSFRIFGGTRVMFATDQGKSYAPNSKYRPHRGRKEVDRAAKRAAKAQAPADA